MVFGLGKSFRSQNRPPSRATDFGSRFRADLQLLVHECEESLLLPDR